MKISRFWFDASLRRLLPRDKVSGEFDCVFNGPQSAKHLIESVGIPHTEIGEITANDRPAGLDYPVQDDDRMKVFGVAPNLNSQVQPRFVIDGHLGRLNSRMRMLGLDCLYQENYNDDTLLILSVHESRILLSRDRRLLMRKPIMHGYLVRSLDPGEQLHELVRRYGLRKWIRPFQRCIRCNHLLEPVRKEDILDRLEPLTKLYFEEFRICPACSQIYWKGSHFDKMQQLIATLG
jgi:uncharacterized protein with PIN domain